MKLYGEPIVPLTPKEVCDLVVLRDFLKLASKGHNCKSIGEILGIDERDFGKKMKKLLGIYPSVYIARMFKHGKT